MKKRSLIVSIVSFTAFVFYLGFFSTDNVVSAEHPSIVPSPIIASQYTDVITIKGNGWGLYTERRDATVLLILVDDANTEIPLTVDQNYMSALDLLLRVNLPQNLAEGDYALSVSAQGGTREATAPFRFVRLPDFRNSNRPIMAVNPTAGPVGAHVFLTVGGFPEKSGLILRFGGQKLSTGLLMTDENGAVGQHAFTIPATITKDFKVSAVTPGKYTIEVSDGRGLFQTVTFTVTDKDKEEEPKKEEPKKEEPKKEEPKKEEPKKEEPKKEEPKKEEPKKEEPKKEIDKPFQNKPCDPNLPRVWQEGCVSAEDRTNEQKPAPQLYVPDSQGKPCKEGLAITFQPGCVSQTKTETIKPFAGKPCDAVLPRTWQEGCIGAQQKIAAQSTQSTATVTIAEKELPLCNPQAPTYSQTSCRRE